MTMKNIEEERKYWVEAAGSDDPTFEMMAELDHETYTKEHVERLQSELSIRPSDRVLELGCGVGRLIYPLSRAYKSSKFIGVDFSQELLDLAPESSNLEYVKNDGRTLPNKKFNKAYSMMVFQHIPKDAVADYIDLIAEALPVGGLFYFQFVEGTTNTHMNRHFTHHEMRQICIDAGFSIKDVQSDSYSPDWTWFSCIKK